MSESGFPQLNTASYPSQLFWLGVAFVVLYFLMSKIALPRVTKVLDARQSYKDTHLNDAGKMNEESEKIKSTYEKSLGQAQQSASETLLSRHQEISEKVSSAQGRFAENARNRLLAAEQAIARAKAEAMQSIADVSADIAMEMVQKIAGIQVDKAEAKKAVTSVMKEG